MNKVFLATAVLFLAFFSSCSSSKSGFKVAATPVPHAQILEFVKPDLKEQGIDLKIVVINDYNIPNRALASQEVDANFFQHLPFLEEQIAAFHYPIASIAKIELEPMGIYSKKISALADLKERAKVSIPNDPTNEGRALLLLQEQGLIRLKDQSSLQSTILQIADNPKQLQFLEVDAAMLPRTLADVDIAVINTNYALEAKLSPQKDALALESKDSPYANILAVRTGEENRPEIVALKKAMTSEKMRQFILDTYHGAVLPAF